MVNQLMKELKEAISTIGEKLSVRRFAIRTKTDNDAFGAFTHGWTHWCINSC